MALKPSSQMLEMPLCSHELSLLHAKQLRASFRWTFRKFLNAPETISHSPGNISCSLGNVSYSPGNISYSPCPGVQLLPLMVQNKMLPNRSNKSYLSTQLWFHRACIHALLLRLSFSSNAVQTKPSHNFNPKVLLKFQ